jgi:ribonuclease P protein component
LPGVAVKVASGFRSEIPETDQRFPRTYRLTARRQFVEVYNRGRKARRSAFTVFGLANDLEHCRLGLTVTRRIGNAVERNRIKRILRDAFRRHREELQVPMDLVINAYSAVLEMPFEQLQHEMLGAVAELARKVKR